MKLNLVNMSDVIFLGRSMQPTNYDGKPGVRYQLLVKGEVDAGSLNCTEEAYKMAESIPEFSKVFLMGDYSSDYRSFKVSGIKVAKD